MSFKVDTMSSEKPNIVLVVMDTARAESFSCYGNERKTTPFLDDLAEENVKYENAVSQARWTLPSHASMFSGEYISDHLASKDMSFSSIKDDCVQRDLKEKGYTTLGVANIGFLAPEYDADELFDDLTHFAPWSIFSGLELDRSDFMERDGLKKYLDLGFHFLRDGSLEDYWKASKRFGYYFKQLSFLSDSGARETNKVALDKLESLDDDEDFFLFLNYKEPHADYKPPAPFSHKFIDGKFRWRGLLNHCREDTIKYMDSDRDFSEQLLQDWKDLYDSELNYLDSRLKKLYEEVKERHPDTVFIFTSDHGEYFNEYGRFDHWSGLHEPVTHVPLIEVFPEDLSKDIESVVETKSLRNHLNDLADGGFEPMEGTDYAFSEDFGRDKSDSFNHHISEEDAEYWSRGSIKIRTESHELIWYEDGEKEIFKIPNEEELEDSDVEEKLSEKIEDRFGNPEEIDFEDGDIEAKDDKIKKSLEELGYL